jgi:hypothetical protein
MFRQSLCITLGTRQLRFPWRYKRREAMSKFRKLGWLLCVAGLIGSPSVVQASILFQNAPDYPSSYDNSPSENGANGLSFFSFSPFQLAGAATIDAIKWQGLYVSADLSANPPPPVATGFQILIFGDLAGLPDPSAVVYGQPNIAKGLGANDVNETFVANDPNFFLGFANQTTAAVYDYSVNLATPVSVSGGTTYWLSIAANSPNDYGLPYWGQNSSGLASNSGGPTYVYDPSGGAFFFWGDDGRTFELDGQVVPEPSTIIIWSLLLGAGWTGLRVWRGRGGPVDRQPWSAATRRAIRDIINRVVPR